LLSTSIANYSGVRSDANSKSGTNGSCFVKVGQLQVILTVEEKVLVAEYRRAQT